MKLRHLSPLFGVVLAFALALTSVSLGMARGQTTVGGQIAVLCAGDGLVQVQLDAQGNPVGPVHYCPDLALTVLAGWAAEAPVPSRPESRAEPSAPVFSPRTASRPVPPAQARGPPVAV